MKKELIWLLLKFKKKAPVSVMQLRTASDTGVLLSFGVRPVFSGFLTYSCADQSPFVITSTISATVLISCRKKFNKKVKEMSKEIREKVIILGLPIKDIVSWMNQVLTGYFHYYGITDNSEMLSSFRFRMMQLLFKNLNRRSQKRSLNWDGFNDLLRDFPLVKGRIYVNIYEN